MKRFLALVDLLTALGWIALVVAIAFQAAKEIRP